MRLAGGRRRSLCGDTLSVSCVSLGRLKRLCSPCAPSAPRWTSPCSLSPVWQRAPHSTAFHFKYTTLHTLRPPYRSVPPGNVTVCVSPQPLSPFFARRISLFSGVGRADLHGVSQEFSLSSFLSRYLNACMLNRFLMFWSFALVCCVIFCYTARQSVKRKKDSIFTVCAVVFFC